MFHTYVTASSGAKIDIDRARYLMDDELFEEAYRQTLDDQFHGRPTLFDIAVAERVGHGTSYRAQQTWNKYRDAHLQKYGEPFEPDVNPNWDQ